MGEGKRKRLRYEELKHIMDGTNAQLREVAAKVTEELTDHGRLVEAGWVSYRLMVMDDAAPQIQREECKMAFFAGAHHVLNSLAIIMDEDREPTERDVTRLQKIHAELEEFKNKLMLRYTDAEGQG